MTAVLFGSISTLADTSELQRRAFNEAFASSGLDWEWSRDEYVGMLGSNGGAQRIRDYAQSRGQDVDAAAVHALKSEIFQRLLGDSEVTPRDGVTATIAEAKKNNHKVGFVTTTSPANIDALLSALEPEISAETFDLIVNKESVAAAKPDAAAYEFALDKLGERADSVVAIEDNLGGVAAAVQAGIPCIAFLNENTSRAEQAEYTAAIQIVDSLDPETVLGLATS
ncbi:HAD-IA family hydrolase [Mycobacterium sp. TY814]|uniref:HAD-IA family hydrolase n=1 Tax=unclassified Mycobacterium TaxID=2642494 RepID=UPI0027416C4F|nr:HAD-IA family hydrolase [Mycobacterium sp. TY814]MDP7723677.1 HAD-IA family hydrolase [Mycobacterium sp. TY814]